MKKYFWSGVPNPTPFELQRYHEWIERLCPNERPPSKSSCQNLAFTPVNPRKMTREKLITWLRENDNLYTLYMLLLLAQEPEFRRKMDDPNLDQENTVMENVHHIIPRFARGSNAQWNRLECSAAEHKVAHLLRYLVYGQQQDLEGFNGISIQSVAWLKARNAKSHATLPQAERNRNRSQSVTSRTDRSSPATKLLLELELFVKLIHPDDRRKTYGHRIVAEVTIPAKAKRPSTLQLNSPNDVCNYLNGLVSPGFRCDPKDFTTRFTRMWSHNFFTQYLGLKPTNYQAAFSSGWMAEGWYLEARKLPAQINREDPATRQKLEEIYTFLQEERARGQNNSEGSNIAAARRGSAGGNTPSAPAPQSSPGAVSLPPPPGPTAQAAPSGLRTPDRTLLSTKVFFTLGLRVRWVNLRGFECLGEQSPTSVVCEIPPIESRTGQINNAGQFYDYLTQQNVREFTTQRQNFIGHVSRRWARPLFRQYLKIDEQNFTSRTKWVCDGWLLDTEYLVEQLNSRVASDPSFSEILDSIRLEEID